MKVSVNDLGFVGFGGALSTTKTYTIVALENPNTNNVTKMAPPDVSAIATFNDTPGNGTEGLPPSQQPFSEQLQTVALTLEADDVWVERVMQPFVNIPQNESIRAVVEGVLSYLDSQYGAGRAVEFVRYAVLETEEPIDDAATVLDALRNTAKLPQLDALDTTDDINFELSEDTESIDDFQSLLELLRKDDVFNTLIDDALEVPAVDAGEANLAPEARSLTGFSGQLSAEAGRFEAEARKILNDIFEA